MYRQTYTHLDCYAFIKLDQIYNICFVFTHTGERSGATVGIVVSSWDDGSASVMFTCCDETFPTRQMCKIIFGLDTDNPAIVSVAESRGFETYKDSQQNFLTELIIPCISGSPPPRTLTAILFTMFKMASAENMETPE